MKRFTIELWRRHWFNGPDLRQWRMMVAYGDYDGAFFMFPSGVFTGTLCARPKERSPSDWEAVA